jgi:hypothetical protein
MKPRLREPFLKSRDPQAPKHHLVAVGAGELRCQELTTMLHLAYFAQAQYNAYKVGVFADVENTRQKTKISPPQLQIRLGYFVFCMKLKRSSNLFEFIYIPLA